MWNIHDIRENNKNGLKNLFFEDYLSDFEDNVFDIIEKLKIQLDLQEKEQVKLSEKIIDPSDSNILNFYWKDYIYPIEEKIKSIYEMVIVNDYKELEIALKTFVSLSLDTKVKSARLFENIRDILDERGIKLSEIQHYNHMNDLKKINNYIKHSNKNEIPEDLKQISEFSNVEYISFRALRDFHRRVFNLREEFIYDLRDKIYSYLYEYDEARIENIATRMVKKMDNHDIDRLIRKLTELNNINN
jgi:hypothetical protein